MADGLNPFSIIGNIVAPRTTGFIMDRLDAQRTAEQEAMETAEEKQNQVYSGRALEAWSARLGGLVQQGMQPDQALAELFRDQNLMNTIMSDPNLDPNELLRTSMSVLQTGAPPAKQPFGFQDVGGRLYRTDPNEGTATPLTAAPSPTPHNVSAGQAAIVPDPAAPGGFREVFNQPPEKVQTFEALAGLAKMTPAQQAEAAQVAMMASTDMTQAERAGQRLKEAGVSEKTVDMLLAGGMTPLTLKTFNPHGEVIAERQVWQAIDGSVFDPAKNAEAEKSSFGRGFNQRDPVALEIPPEIAETYGTDPPEVLQETRNTSALGVGAVPILYNWAGSALQLFDPALLPEPMQMARRRRDWLNGLRQALMNAREQGSGLGLPIAALDISLKQAPGMGPFEGQRFALNQQLGLYYMTKGQIETDMELIEDPMVSKATKGEAEKRIQMMRRILRFLPESPEIMIELDKDLARRQAGVSAVRGIKEGWQMLFNPEAPTVKSAEDVSKAPIEDLKAWRANTSREERAKLPTDVLGAIVKRLQEGK